MKILVLNAGSSSQKSCVYDVGETLPVAPPTPLWEGKIDWSQKSGMAVIEVETHRGESQEREVPSEDKAKDLSQMLATLTEGETAVLGSLEEIDAVGHRVVHGGDKYQESVQITAAVKEAIASLIPLAPKHNPAHLEGIEAIEQILPKVPQIAVFDTAFHTRIPEAAAVYPIPYEFYQQGIRRYGFHGISHEYCLQRSAQLLNEDPKNLQIITAHIGNGCSLAAIRDGFSVNTTMGYTPLEGLMMGTRSGSIDPAILIHLMRQGYESDRLDALLNEESGLKGLSGISSDMRAVDKAIARGEERAILAFEVYAHRLRFFLGAMLASLDRLDALVFTAGVGEHQASLRASACDAFKCLGVKLDSDKNQDSPADTDIATADSTARILIIHTQEDWAIARNCWQLLSSS